MQQQISLHTGNSSLQCFRSNIQHRWIFSEILQCCGSSFLDSSTPHPPPSRLLCVPWHSIAQQPHPPSCALTHRALSANLGWPGPPARSSLPTSLEKISSQPISCLCFGGLFGCRICWRIFAQIIREDIYTDAVVFTIRLEGMQRRGKFKDMCCLLCHSAMGTSWMYVKFVR